MKIVEYFKKLFKKKDEHVLSEKQDVFGHNIFANEIVFPIKYNELKRCGYVTIDGDLTGFYVSQLNQSQFNKGVVASSSLQMRNLTEKVKKGQRGNFYHVYR